MQNNLKWMSSPGNKHMLLLYLLNGYFLRTNQYTELSESQPFLKRIVLEITKMMVVSKYLLLCLNNFIYNSATFRDLSKLFCSQLVYWTLYSCRKWLSLHALLWISACLVGEQTVSSFTWQTMCTLFNTSPQSSPRLLYQTARTLEWKNERFQTLLTLKVVSFFSHPPISPQSWGYL